MCWSASSPNRFSCSASVKAMLLFYKRSIGKMLYLISMQCGKQHAKNKLTRYLLFIYYYYYLYIYIVFISTVEVGCLSLKYFFLKRNLKIYICVNIKTYSNIGNLPAVHLVPYFFGIFFNRIQIICFLTPRTQTKLHQLMYTMNQCQYSTI